MELLKKIDFTSYKDFAPTALAPQKPQKPV
jgi:hypothetical protein